MALIKRVREFDATDTAIMSPRMWIACALFTLAMALCLVTGFAVLAAGVAESVLPLLLATLALAYAGSLFAAWRASAWLDARRHEIGFSVNLVDKLSHLRQALARRVANRTQQV